MQIPRRLYVLSLFLILAALLTACAIRVPRPTPPTRTPVPDAPTTEPTTEPTAEPTSEPTTEATAEKTAIPIGDAAPSSTRIIGYYTSWSIYGRGFHVSEVDASRLTHLNYAFANVDYENFTCKIGDEWADLDIPYPGDLEGDGNLRGNIHQLQLLKERYPHLKVMISVGGWTWSGNFSEASLTAESREKLVKSCIDLFIKGEYGKFGTHPGIFDGIDVDWEYPVGGGLAEGIPEDKQNHLLLMQEFRRQLDALTEETGKTYELSIASGAGPAVIANMELAQLAETLDFMTVMAYDFHGSWEMTTNFNAPLYFSSTDPAEDATNFNVDQSVQNYLAAGVPPEKLVLGLPFYGKSWMEVEAANDGLYQAAGKAGPGTWEDGILDYSKILSDYEPTYAKFRHPEANVPWLFDNGVFITYDDQETVIAKAEYIRANNLGGAMFWELSCDVQGIPAPPDSLLYALYAALNP